MSDDLRAPAEAIRAADHVVAFTGAGISTASGIPDFRSDGGIWDQFDPAEFHYQRFKRDPAGFWEKRLELYDTIFDAAIEPNAAHEALGRLEEAGELDAVITQNIDGLHQAAGSGTVIELHGNGQRVVCDDCGRRTTLAETRRRIADGELPPRCGECSGSLKPDVVLFGEELPEPTMQAARRHAREAELFLAIGSSLTVEPAASLPRIARRTGGSVLVVNLEEPDLARTPDFEFRDDVTALLPALAERVDPS